MKMKKCNLIFACFIVFSILFIALPGFSQDSTLEVKCADSSGNPLKDVKVVAFNLGERKAKDEKTDARGVAEFKKMKDGIYRVFGHKDGFAPAFFEFVELKGSADTVTLNFAAGADKKLYFEDEAEEKAASELSIKGFGLLQEKKPAEAEPVLMQSLEISPSNTDTLYYLALANLQLGNFDQGVEFLKKTINIANMLKNVMADASGQTHYEETVQKAQQLLLKIPAIKGDYALRQKKYDAAIAGFSEAIKSEPENADYYANLAIALTNAKRLDEAVTAINKADQLKPGVYEDLKKNIETRKENQTLMEAQKILDDGKKLLKDGNAAEALKKFEEAKGMVPEDKQATLWLQIGQAQDKLNQPEAAAGL